jgi:hypothetical protein
MIWEEVVKGFLRKVVIVSILIFTVSLSQANLIIDDMQINLMTTKFYDKIQQCFQLTYNTLPSPAIIFTGLISTTTSANYDYQFNGTVSITPANLLQDQTVENGGWAKGVFAGGSTITITGSLWNSATPGTLIINSGTILTAQMPSDSWYLEELPSPPAPANRVRGSAFFSPTGGGLYNGNNSAGLTLYGFRADYTFASTTPAVTNFSSANSYSCSSPKIQIVPEPVSMVFFSMVALLLAYKRK